MAIELVSARAGDSALDTFPKLLLWNAQRFADRPAYRFKDLGIWQSWTWRDVRRQVRDFAVALNAAGLKRGDRIAIVGTNRPRLYWTFLAAQSLGAIPVPVYADSVADELAYVLDHAEVVMAVVEDQEQVDKLLSVAERVPRLAHVIYDNDRGLQKYDHTRLHAFAEMAQYGAKQSGERDSDAWWLKEIATGTGAARKVSGKVVAAERGSTGTGGAGGGASGGVTAACVFVGTGSATAGFLGAVVGRVMI